MKTFKGLLFVGLLTVGSAFGLGACSDDTDTTTSTTTTSSSSSTGSSSSSSSTGSSSSGAAGLSCTSYCTAVMANCTGAMNTQYGSEAECMGACAMLEAGGKLGTEADMSGDTVGCRAYHAGAAATDAATHCAHAGPFGGGVCGDLCENFCTLAVATCKTQYPDNTACMADCGGYAKMPNYSYQATGDNYACRAYHLTAAAAPGGAATHCAHTAKMSSTCM